MHAISVSNLRRIYNVYEKETGVFGALKSVVYRRRKQIIAVDDVSFDIPFGQIVGFVGPNGSGKTTTLKMLSGILTPTHGECSVLGFTPSHRKRDFRRKISLVMGQKSQLIWDLPAIDTFRMHRDLYQVDEKKWNATLGNLVDLLDVSHVLETPVRQLSLGERMKCELIVALLHEPQVLFLDEPTIGLDAIAQRHLRSFLHDYQQASGTTVLITSHYTQDISNLCPRVIVIKKGKVVYDGDYSKLMAIAEIEKRVLMRFRDRPTQENIEKLSAIATLRNLEKIDSHTYRMSVAGKEFNKTAESIFRDFSIEYFQAEEADLTNVLVPSFDALVQGRGAKA